MQTPSIYALIKADSKSIVINNNFNAQKNPHYNFSILVNDENYVININVRSRVRTKPDLKVFCLDNESALINKQPFDLAKKLNQGIYHDLKNQNLALDYLRGNYFDLANFTIPETNSNDKNQDYLMDLLDHHIKQAQQNAYQMCIWGFAYNDNQKKGMHDIHMNQGNNNNYNNAVWTDGAIFVYDQDQIVFGCFLAFESQCLKTDDNGNCAK